MFQMDSSGAAEAGVAVGQTHMGRKGRENRELSAGVWAEEDEAKIFKVKKLFIFLIFLREGAGRFMRSRGVGEMMRKTFLLETPRTFTRRYRPLGL